MAIVPSHDWGQVRAQLREKFGLIAATAAAAPDDLPTADPNLNLELIIRDELLSAQQRE